MLQVTVPYSFYGNNQQALYCRDPEMMLAGPADTGKTITLLTRLHLLAYKFPNASLVIARAKLTDIYSTVLQTYQKKILSPESPVTAYGGEKPQWFDYPNGSRIWVAGLDKPGKVLSAEHDVIYVNQAEELDLQSWETLTTRVSGRAGNVPYPQCLGDCNPEHPTHWILNRAKTGHLTILNSTHRDNPELYDQETGEITPAGKRRLGTLRKLTGSRLQRLYHGLWSAPEGAIYSCFDERRHKLPAYREIPPDWARLVSIDPHGAYIVALWAVFDEDRRKIVVYREYAGEFGISTAEHARKILDICKKHHERPFVFVGGAEAERQARVDFQAAGLPLIAPPNIGLDGGINRVIRGFEEDVLALTEDCPGTISDIGGYRRRMVDGYAIDEIVNKGAFHYADALRYKMAFLLDSDIEVEEEVYLPVRIY